MDLIRQIWINGIFYENKLSEIEQSNSIKLLGGMTMYVEQFWKYFEQTGSLETYLDLKEYEKLYEEHTNPAYIQNNDQINESSVDRMK